MTDMSEVAEGRPVGLRERKKARTRAAIREHALRLFREQGYPATTVEQIAAAADVSPATFFRYFPTKEDVVLQDDLDIVTLEALAAQPPELSPIAAFRAAATQSLAAMSPADLQRFGETTHLTAVVPEVRARALDEFARTIDGIAGALARRVGRDPDDFAVRTLAGAVIGVIMSATMPWAEADRADISEMFQRIDAALAQLEAGLPLWPPRTRPPVLRPPARHSPRTRPPVLRPPARRSPSGCRSSGMLCVQLPLAWAAAWRALYS
jgi:AcrR family transcriptional regulator